VAYLDTATTSETTNSRLSDTLDVVPKDLAMTLGSALFVRMSKSAREKVLESYAYLAEPFAAFAACFFKPVS
jgi:hypothetical protein